MVTNPKSNEDQNNLNERLRSLKIDRASAPSSTTRSRSPKLLLLGISGFLALLALGYVFLFSGAKTISVASVRVETGSAQQGESVLSASGYVVAHHKIAVGAKVMGRVAWIGVEKGDIVQEGQVLVRLEDSEFRAQVNQARANLAAAQARVDQLRSGSRPQEKLRDRASVLQAEANLKTAEADYQRSEKLYRAGVSSKADLDHALAQRDTAAALLEAARQSSSMTDVETTVLEWARKLFTDKAIAPERPLRELSLDSIDMLEFKMCLENEFDIELDLEVFDEKSTLSSIANWISLLVRQQNDAGH